MATCLHCGAANPPAARFCSNCGEPLEARAGAARESRKTVTVIFCDVVGSTALGERHDPEVVRAMMARFYATARGPVTRRGGRVEKVIGDALVAVFGVPQVQEDDALQAVAAALEMRDAVTGGGELEVRIGVNTGDVLARDATAAEALVVGDAVNVAARLEQAAAAGEVLVGEATWALVAHAAAGTRIAPVEAKGKSAPVVAWRLESIDATASGQRRRLDLPMVGRATELGLLRGLLDRARGTGRPHLATVIGQPGIGKSRLLAELLGETDEATILTAQCRPSAGAWSMGPLVEAVAMLSPAQLREGFADPGEAEAVAASFAPGSMAGVADVSWAAARLLGALSASAPVLLAVEDIHWADPALLDLVQQLVRTREMPLAVVCTSRPEILQGRAGWGAAANALTLSLEPLDDAETAQLLGVAHPGLGMARAREVVAAAEGNPLFAEHLAALVETGSAGGLPRSIQLLLTARLEALPDPERDVATVAAVVGREFDEAAVEALVGADPSGLLEVLAERQLAEQLGKGRWRYSHALLQEAAYGLLPKGRRAELHQTLAGWYDARGADDAVIAEHLDRALALRRELSERGAAVDALAAAAGTRLVAAGRRSDALGDPVRATTQLRRALELLPAESPEAAAAMVELAAAGWEPMERDETRELLRAGGAIAGAHGLRALELRARILLLGAGESDRTYPMTEVVDEVRAARAELESLDDPRALAAALTTIAVAEFELGHAAAAEKEALQAVEILREADQDMVWALSLVVVAALEAPLPLAEVERLFSGLVALAGVRPAARVELIRGLALLSGLAGRPVEAADRFDAAEQLERDIGRPTRRTAFQRAMTEARMEPSGEVAGRLDEFAHLYDERVAFEVSSLCYAAAALVYLHLGDTSAAATAAAAAHARTENLYEPEVRVNIALAEVHLAQRELDAAAAAARLAADRALGGDWSVLIGDAHRTLARVLAACGDAPGAQAAGAAAARAYAAKGLDPGSVVFFGLG